MGNFTVEGKIVHAAGVWGPAIGCRGSVTIWDGDTGSGRDDLIFHIDRADPDGAFHGSTSRDWFTTVTTSTTSCCRCPGQDCH
jgi:hypothetical protein